MIRGLIAAIAFCLLAPQAMAQAMLVDRYDEAAIRKVVEELGYRVTDATVGSDGEPSLTVEMSGDLAFVIDGLFCRGEGKAQVCSGVQMAAIMGDPGGKDLDSVADKFNRTYRPAKLFVTTRGLVLERYLIMDHGVTVGNLKTNINVFCDMLTAIWENLYD